MSWVVDDRKTFQAKIGETGFNLGDPRVIIGSIVAALGLLIGLGAKK